MSLLVMFNHLLFVNTFAARSLPLTPCRLSFWRINWENMPLPPCSLWTASAKPGARQGNPGRAGTWDTAPCFPDGAFSTGGCRAPWPGRIVTGTIVHHWGGRGCADTGMGQRMLLGAWDNARSSGEQSLGDELLQGRDRRQEQEGKAQLSEHTWVNQGA